MSGFGSLSVGGHKAAVAAEERRELHEKLQKKVAEQQYRQQMQPPRPPPPPPQMPASVIKQFNDKLAHKSKDKERLEIIKITRKIERYYNGFGETTLKDRKRKNFTSNTTLIEAEEEIASIEAALAASNAYHNCENMYMWGAEIVSNMGPKVGLRTHNAKEVLCEKSNLKVVEPELLEISIKYEEWFSQGPMVRLAQKVIYMIRAIHEENTKQAMKDLKEPTPEHIANKYANL